MLLRPMSTPGRAAEGEPIGVSCNTCHQVDRGGSDHTGDPPGNVVSIGAGAYDVNGMQTFNAAYLDLVYWNGRSSMSSSSDWPEKSSSK
jgi:cytochrome c peroxidase